MLDRFGPNAFKPASEHDAFPKHDKMKVNTYIDYQRYTEKMRREAEAKNRKKMEQRYDELFERYEVPRTLRQYIFYSDLQKVEDKNSIEYLAKLDQF